MKNYYIKLTYGGKKTVEFVRNAENAVDAIEKLSKQYGWFIDFEGINPSKSVCTGKILKKNGDGMICVSWFLSDHGKYSYSQYSNLFMQKDAKFYRVGSKYSGV